MNGDIELLVSATRAHTVALLHDGPRRDFLELAEASGAIVAYQEARSNHSGFASKFVGPHVRQAWRAARRLNRGATVFADGEHNGLPLVIFAALLGRRPGRVVMLGHLVSRRWKLPLLWVATRLGPRGVLVLHSVEQRRILAPWVGRRWRVVLTPYQVDTDFWTPGHARPDGGLPLILAVGSENRDYATLVRAVDGLPVRVVIAAGSHWARETAGASALPANVRRLTEPLGFSALRDLYRESACVVVPLHDVPNQSGVTTILEAMSCARPIVVTASRGQQECVEGPLVRADGSLDAAATSARGPKVFGASAGCESTGLYVAPGDSDALRAAIERVLADGPRASLMAAAARRAAVEHFSIERFVETLSALLVPPSRGEPAAVKVAA